MAIALASSKSFSAFSLASCSAFSLAASSCAILFSAKRILASIKTSFTLSILFALAMSLKAFNLCSFVKSGILPSSAIAIALASSRLFLASSSLTNFSNSLSIVGLSPFSA